jgi:predicted dehydrogenase
LVYLELASEQPSFEVVVMLRGGVVGYGFIAENGHFPAYDSLRAEGLLEIVAVADPTPARRARAKALRPGLRVYESHQALLERERGLDFVDVATPPADHAAITHAALARGLHVFCEKPLATSGRDAASMVAHAERARRVLFPSHNYKHAPVVKAVRAALDAGLVGDVRLVTLHTFRATHARGVSEWRPDWRRERRFSGGGVAMDHGSHTFYLAFDWFGGFPTAITAKASTLGSYDTEDDLSCTLTFPRGVASAHLTWNAGVRKVIYSVHGTRGAVRVEDDEVEISTMQKGPGGSTTWATERAVVTSDWMDPSHVRWFQSVFLRFCAAIEHREYAGKDALESVRCVELIEAAYESSRRRSPEILLGPASLRDRQEPTLRAG